MKGKCTHALAAAAHRVCRNSGCRADPARHAAADWRDRVDQPIEVEFVSFRKRCHKRAMSGAWLAHDIGRKGPSDNHGQRREVCWRRKLLIPYLVFASERMRRQRLDEGSDFRNLVQHLWFVRRSRHVACQCGLEQVKDVSLAPGGIGGALLPKEPGHRLKEALLVGLPGGDGVLDLCS